MVAGKAKLLNLAKCHDSLVLLNISRVRKIYTTLTVRTAEFEKQTPICSRSSFSEGRLNFGGIWQCHSIELGTVGV